MSEQERKEIGTQLEAITGALPDVGSRENASAIVGLLGRFLCDLNRIADAQEELALTARWQYEYNAASTGAHR